MTEQSPYELYARGERSDARFSCSLAHVDLCTRLLKRESAHNETEEKLKEALRERDKYQEYFKSLMSVVTSIFDQRSIILSIFNSRLTPIRGVKARYFAQSKRGLTVWLFVEEDNWEDEEEIYEAYGELLDLFPDADIDFRLLKLFGRQPEELLPRNFESW